MIRIDKKQLLRGLDLAHGIDDRKSTMPILANVLLRSEGKDKIICAATDLNVAVVATLPAKVEKEGGLTVAPRQLYEIAKRLSADEIPLKRNDPNCAEISAARAEFKV